MTASFYQRGRVHIESRFVAAVAVGIFSSTALLATPAVAQSASDSATAQALFDRARKLMQAGKYAEACPALAESERIESRSGTKLNLADCYQHEGRLASAWSAFIEAAVLSKADGNTARERGARERAAALVPRLANLVISAPSAASTPELEVTRDGERIGTAQLGLPLPVDSGAHTIVAKAPGRKKWQTELTVSPGSGTTTVTIPELEGDAQAAPSPLPGAAVGAPTNGAGVSEPVHSPPPAGGSNGRPMQVAGLATSGVGIVVGLVGLFVYRDGASKLNAIKQDASSGTPYNPSNGNFKTLGTAGSGLMIAGGAAVAAGVTLYLLGSGRQEQSAHVALGLTPGAGGSIQIAGTFK